jgi:hypothetical protein
MKDIIPIKLEIPNIKRTIDAYYDFDKNLTCNIALLLFESKIAHSNDHGLYLVDTYSLFLKSTYPIDLKFFKSRFLN